MPSGQLLASSSLLIERIVPRPDRVELFARCRASAAPCPVCGILSCRVQSRYARTLADLPWHGVPVLIQLRVRRFFCDVRECSRKVFAERPLDLAAPRGRRTLRLAQTLERIAFALGGEPGARLACNLGMEVSPDTLLRLIRRASLPVNATPKVLGVDDWALRRGHRYGTILIDLETHTRIDLLPDRTAQTFASWLTSHPGAEIISRDRGCSYAEGARLGAPAAVQVADRWHLLANLGDAVQRFLATRHEGLTAVGRILTERARARATIDQEEIPPLTQGTPELPDMVLERSREQRTSDAKRARRLARYERVVDLAKAGASKKAIAREMGLDIKTVRKYLSAGAFPERAPRRSPSSPIDRFREHLARRWAEGCRNAAQLWREIRGEGYRGAYQCVVRVVQSWRSEDGRGRWKQIAPRGPRPSEPVKAPSPRRAMWLLMRAEDELDADEREAREVILEQCTDARLASQIGNEFQAIIRGQHVELFQAWLTEARRCGIAALEGFATGLEKDRNAVEAALSYEWSNGQTEGQVNRLKMIKRSMYGRAKFDLLRARVLHQ